MPATPKPHLAGSRSGMTNGKAASTRAIEGKSRGRTAQPVGNVVREGTPRGTSPTVSVGTRMTNENLPAAPRAVCHSSKEVTIIPGVVWEFRGDDAVVELTSEGQVHRRLMAAGALKRAGIDEEGQAFELRITEIAPDPPARWEVEVRNTTPPGQLAPRQLRPNADFSKFKRRG